MPFYKKKIEILLSIGIAAMLFLSQGCVGNSKHTISDKESDQRISKYNKKVPESRRIRCETTAPVGSLIKHRSCKPQWKIDQEENESNQVMTHTQRSRQ